MGERLPPAERVSAGDLGRGPGHGGYRRASKYRAVRAKSYDGRSFASKAERDRYHELLHLVRVGEIEGLELQPAWHFTINDRPLLVGGRRVRYTADFRYTDRRTGAVVVEDVKGVLTRDASLRIALMAVVHGITVKLVKPRRR